LKKTIIIFRKQKPKNLKLELFGFLKATSTALIGQWRRRLECVVQQQGGHIEHLM